MKSRPSIIEIMKMIERLSAEDNDVLKSRLLDSDSESHDCFDGYLTDERHAKGRACQHCGSIRIARNGHRPDGTQRYLCRECGKSFVVSVNSIAFSTKKDIAVWEKYISCMMLGLSIRKSADICGIHRNTAFYWRHKILDALSSVMNEVELDGIVEMDETFFPISYKGNHSKSKTFQMPREPHRRGKETHVRGISKEQVCVPCAVNRSGASLAMVSNLGRVAAKNIHAVFDGKIAEDSTLVTDKMNSYVRFADASGLELVQLKNGKAKKGIYNIQRINSYHSKLKKFMSKFNGVSTKYLNNYLVWNGFVNYMKEADAEKRNLMMRYAFTAVKKVLCREISDRPAIPVLG